MEHSVSTGNKARLALRQQAQDIFNHQLAMHFSPQDKKTLLIEARQSIATLCQHRSDKFCDLSQYSLQLQQQMACFVTLTKQHRLRGCIGSLTPHQPLIQDVRHNARSAASEDPRFAAISEDELAQIHIEISVLSPIQLMHCNSEEDLLEQLRVGIDGLIIEYAQHKATFLPLVWEQIDDKDEFLTELKLKAGMKPEFWSDKMHVSRYQTLIIEEPHTH